MANSGSAECDGNTGALLQASLEAARAAQEPFKTFQSAELQRAQRKADRAEDIFSGALASEYDLEEQRLKNLGESDERRTAEVEAGIIKNAHMAIGGHCRHSKQEYKQ